eukprot:m.154516 g.154516  ORF g.154516 m.154516 type:complete len:63 (-) comp52891_c0_seq4:1674-1862(-)
MARFTAGIEEDVEVEVEEDDPQLHITQVPDHIFFQPPKKKVAPTVPLVPSLPTLPPVYLMAP